MKNDITVYAAPNTTRFSFEIDLQKEKNIIIRRMKQIQKSLTETEEAEFQAYRDAMLTV